MNVKTRHVALAAATSLVSAGILARRPNAAPTKVNGGQTTLTLTAKGEEAAQKRHIKLVATQARQGQGPYLRTAREDRQVRLRHQQGHGQPGRFAALQEGQEGREDHGHQRHARQELEGRREGRRPQDDARQAGPQQAEGEVIGRQPVGVGASRFRSARPRPSGSTRSCAARAFKGSQLGTISVRVHKPNGSASRVRPPRRTTRRPRRSASRRALRRRWRTTGSPRPHCRERTCCRTVRSASRSRA